MKKDTKIKIIVILFIILMVFLIYIKIKNDNDETTIESAKMSEIFENVNTSTYANVTKYIVYGTHFNIEGSIDIPDISKISISNVNVVLRKSAQQETKLDTSYKYNNGNLTFSTIEEINEGIYLEDLQLSNYYIFVKVTFSNNETNYYSLKNATKYGDIEYYTITKDNSNNKINIMFDSYDNLNYMKIAVAEANNLPDDVYDIVIDPGHGGNDLGAKSGEYNEASLVLNFGLELKQELEKEGYKVLITRDGSDEEEVSSDMYSENGRVTIANESHAKLLISLHMDSNEYSLSSGGIEVYAPCECNLSFAKTLADNIVQTANTTYSPLNLYKKEDGVYVHNFNDADILALKNTANKRGYEPYNVTTSTPYLYIIRETGGIATNAFVDGRNTSYSANKYYDSNVGIESYLIELGYINVKEDLDNLMANQSLYVKAIVQSIVTIQ